MRALVGISYWLVAILAALPSWAQDFSKVELTTIKVVDGVSVIAGGGGNIGVLVGDEGALLIDTAYGQLEGKIREALRVIGTKQVRFVINTHWHSDHVGCNACFAGDGAVVIAPAGTRARMAEAQEFPLIGLRSQPAAPAALPTIEVGVEDEVEFAGEVVRLVRFAGAHSGSDLAVLLERSNVLHTGDLYWSQGYPYIGTPHGGSVEGLIAAANRMLEMIDESTRIIPGHGAVSDEEGLVHYRDLLVEVRDRVAAEIADGKSIDEIVASAPTAAWDDQRQVGMPPDEFVRLVHRDLTGHSVALTQD